LKPGISFEDFSLSTKKDAPPSGLSSALEALWHLKKGDWDKAHEFAQKDEGVNGSWVHALLHRIEGDEGNADYWYGKAGKKKSVHPTDEEWAEIAKALLP